MTSPIVAVRPVRAGSDRRFRTNATSFPAGSETTAVGRESLEQRRRRPVRVAEALAERLDTRQHVADSEAICVVQRSAAIAREAVTGKPHRIDVRWAGYHRFVENLRAFVDQSQKTTLHDLGGRDRPSVDAALARVVDE